MTARFWFFDETKVGRLRVVERRKNRINARSTTTLPAIYICINSVDMYTASNDDRARIAFIRAYDLFEKIKKVRLLDRYTG